MAIETKYFSEAAEISASASGSNLSGDTWANRAALFDASNNWSSIITEFDFASGSNSLFCLIGSASYTCGESLTTAAFINGIPTVTNPLVLHGCDSSGNALAPPDPGWVSAQPTWDDSGMPVIASSVVESIYCPYTFLRLLKFTLTGANGNLVRGGVGNYADWCIFQNNQSHASSVGGRDIVAVNCVFECTGTAFATVYNYSSAHRVKSCRMIGNASSASGTSGGIIAYGQTTNGIIGCTIANCPGGGIIATGNTSTSAFLEVANCTIANCGSAGILASGTASQTNTWPISNCMITGCATYGIDPDESRFLITGCRLRDSTSDQIAPTGNYPDTLGNYTTDSDDATEYVDAANGDYRIKATSAIWGKGYGAGDEIPTPAAIATAVWARSGRSLTS